MVDLDYDCVLVPSEPTGDPETASKSSAGLSVEEEEENDASETERVQKDSWDSS